MLRSVHIAVLAASSFMLSNAILAGPSFNSDRGKLAGLSTQAGGQLQKAFMSFHEMFFYLEHKELKAVEKYRSTTLSQMKGALASFRELERLAPAQPLKIVSITDDDKRAISRLRSRLAQEKIRFPETEKELAALAVKVVGQFKTDLEATRFSGTTKDQHKIWNVIQSKSYLEEVGILASIAWTLSAS